MEMNTIETLDPPWGHMIQPKAPNTIQLLLQNIRGIDVTSTGSIKLVAMQSFTQAAQIDICALTECNVE